MIVRSFHACLVAFALVSVVTGCELVADFDRDKIPVPPRDAASFPDVDIGEPRDSGTATDGSTTDGSTDGGDAAPAGNDDDAG